jgi:putative endonuclease
MRGEDRLLYILELLPSTLIPLPAIMWFVYIVRCADGTLYTGITKDVARRVAEHNAPGMSGASYTRGRRPVALVYTETLTTRSAAATREYAIKQMTRQGKNALVRAGRSQRPLPAQGNGRIPADR